MSSNLLLDTDIIVNVGRGNASTAEQVNSMMAAGLVHISAVTEHRC